MKWFKHISDSLDDPFIFDLVNNYGGNGYLVFFGTIEIMAREFNADSPESCKVSLKFLSQKLQLSVRFILKVLDFCSENNRIFYKLDGLLIGLNCPKLIKLCDEFTQKTLKQKSGLSPDKIGIKSVIEEDKEEEVDKDKEEYKPPISPKKRGMMYTDDFNTFWKVYPKKVGKDAAWRRWKSLNGTRPALAVLVSAISKQAQSDQWQRDNGQYIPNPATWLHEGRWADEDVIPESPIDAWARNKQAEMEAAKNGTI